MIAVSSFFDNVFFSVFFSLVWCMLALFFAWMSRIINRNKGPFIIPLAIGYVIYGIFLAALISEYDPTEENPMLAIFATALSLLVLIIQHRRIVKENKENSSET